jgi:ketosteroid isomerase-like protein
MIGGLIALMATGLAACSGSDTDPAAAEAQRKADMWEIDSIEKRFHEATTNQDIEQMMTLWAPNATLTVGPGATATGVDEIRGFWLNESTAFQDEASYWISDHPAYKVEITVHGDRGTLHFECHYVDSNTEKVVAATVADLDVARLEGTWLITNFVAGTTDLE